MIPTTQELVEVHARVCVHEGVAPVRNLIALAACHNTAARLAEHHGDLAAMVFVCGSHPKAFGLAWIATTMALARFIAATEGKSLVLTPTALQAMLLAIARRERSIEQLSEWLEQFALRGLPPSSRGGQA